MHRYLGISVLMCLFGCATQQAIEKTFVEDVGSLDQIVRITTKGSPTSDMLCFSGIDETEFEALHKELYVTPGCRCVITVIGRRAYSCASDWPPVPVCIDAQAGKTYIISAVKGWSLEFWVHEWRSAEVETKLKGQTPIFPRPKYSRKKDALFVVKKDDLPFCEKNRWKLPQSG